MASSATKMANEPEQTGEERQPDVQLQDVLFSALVTSVCYWTTIFLLAIVGAIPDSLVAHPSRTLRRAGERSVGHHHTSVADIAAGADRRRRISRTCGLVRPTRTADLEDAHNGRQPGRRHGLQQVARNLSGADVEQPQAARRWAVREVHI